MSAPEEYLCTSRPSISLASSIWAQTSSIILELLPRHPTGPLVCELDQGGWLPTSDACAGRGRRQLASAIFEIHGQELVSGEIFNGSSGKSVIAEGLANASLWGTDELRNWTGRLQVTIFEGLQDFFSSDKMRKHLYFTVNYHIFWPTSRHF